MQVKNLHNWNLTPKEAIELQKQLSGRVMFTPLKKTPKLIAGLDCAFSKDGKKIIAAAIVLTIPEFEIIETKSAVRKVTMPYIPGLLSFREAPTCISAVEKLTTNPDIILIDGQGIAHPRRLGLASHLGLFFDKPTIGCAKSRLIGTFKQPAISKGSFTLLKDNDDIIGAVVRTRDNVKPLFVSVGNKCTLEDAIQIVLTCAVRYRLAEPTRLADKLVSQLKLKA